MNSFRKVRGLGWAVLACALGACAKGDGGAGTGTGASGAGGEVAGAGAGTGGSGGAAVVAGGSEAKGVETWFPLAVGGKAVRVQIAVLQAEQQRGLMGRRDLGEDEGMVFGYPAPQQMRFWMRNTPSPLDIGFFKPD